MNAIKSNPIPVLTAEERREALKKGLRARQARAKIRKKLADGKITLEEIVETKDEVIRRMKVVDLLKAYRGIGDTKARKIMDELKISQSRRVGGLGIKQKEKLLIFAAKHMNK